MKSLKKVVLFATVLGLTSLLFAGQPESLKKKATAGLIEDGLVDDFDVGVDDVKGLWFGGYNGQFSDFNFGYGVYLGKIWLSVFDEINASSFLSKKGAEKTIDEIAEDTVNVDKTKTTSKEYEEKKVSKFSNELNVAFAVNKVGAQLFWDVSDLSNNPDQKDNYTEIKDGVIKTQNKNAYLGFNDVGANFNGVGIRDIGKVNFYLDLKQINCLFITNKSESTITTEADPNADPEEDPVTSFTNSNSSYKAVSYKPQAVVEFGFKLPAIGKSVSTVSFNEKFNCEIPGKIIDNSKSETVDTSDINETITTTTILNTDEDTIVKWENTLTPKIKTTYDVGENLVIKTALEAAVTVSNDCSGLNSRKTSVTETVTTDNVNAKTTKTRTEKEGYGGSFNNYLDTSISTSVTPKISCGLSYALKPNKCYVNIGALWQAGTFTWNYTTTTMQTGTETTKKTVTDEFGQETVTQDDVTILSADTPNEDSNPAKESVEYTFTGSDPAADKLYVGTTWMLNENASIDLLYAAGVNTFSFLGTNGMFTSSLSATFTIKF